MNLKDYSLHEHLEYTLNSFYENQSLALRIDTNEGVVSKRVYQHYQTLNKSRLCYIRQLGSGINIEYDDAQYFYEKNFSTEKLVTPNMAYQKNVLKNIIINKVNHLYRKTNNIKEILITVLNNKNIKELLEVDSNYKIHKILCDNFNYTEKYTLSSKKLVLSELSTNYVVIKMRKTVHSDTGTLIISSFIGGLKRINFEFQGEPCLLRLLNKSFIFNALVSTELGTIIDEVYDAIEILIDKMKLRKVNKDKVDEIVEYYKQYGS